MQPQILTARFSWRLFRTLMSRVTQMDDDGQTRDAVRMESSSDRLDRRSRSFRFCRVVPWEIATMTRLTTHLSHLPVSSTEMTGEDRVTYRKWAYGWFIGYSVMIGGMVAVSLATRPAPPTVQASRAIDAVTTADSTSSIPVSRRIERRK
jgi:hypothetical protein